MTNNLDMIPQQMVYPCMFYRMASFECALCRYGQGNNVREAIMKTLESILRGLIQMKGFTPKNETKLVHVARYIEKEFIAGGLENPVKAVICFGLLKIGDQFVCGSHNIWFRSSFQEVIPFLLESSEGNMGAFVILQPLLQENFPKKSNNLTIPF